jgi:hypothetical protein
MMRPIPNKAEIESKIEQLEQLLEFNPTGLPAAAIATELMRLEKQLKELEKEESE